jgi:hypothetical protein
MPETKVSMYVDWKVKWDVVILTSMGGVAHPARDPPKIGKNIIFWRKIVIFHTKYPQNFRAFLRSAQFF